MKLRRSPVFNGSLPAAFFPRGYANVRRRRNRQWLNRRGCNRRWSSVLRRGIAPRRPLVASRRDIFALRQGAMARLQGIIARQRLPLLPPIQEYMARRRQVIARQRGSIFLGQTVVAVPSQFIALRRGFIAVLVWSIAVLSQPIAAYRSATAVATGGRRSFCDGIATATAMSQMAQKGCVFFVVAVADGYW